MLAVGGSQRKWRWNTLNPHADGTLLCRHCRALLAFPSRSVDPKPQTDDQKDAMNVGSLRMTSRLELKPRSRFHAWPAASHESARTSVSQRTCG